MSAMHATRSTHLILNLITLIVFGEEYKLWTSSLCTFLQPPFTSSFVHPNTVLSTLFWGTLNYVLPLGLESMFYTSTNTSKIIVLYILICMVLGRRWEDKIYETKFK